MMLAVCNRTVAQNLVPNGSFEEYTKCPPDSEGMIVYAQDWLGYFNRSLTYPKPYPTVEFFHRCGIYPSFFTGYKLPRSGQGMSGMFYLFYYHDVVRHVEWLTTKLNDTLKKDTTYCVSFFVRKLDAYKTGTLSTHFNMAINTFTATFTPDTLIGESTPVQNWWPSSQVVYNDTIIDDTENWSRIYGSFKAKGDEAYLTIGNGLPVSQIQYSPDTIWWNKAYYNLDDVAVWTCSVKAEKADAGPDHSICKGQEVQIGTHDLMNYQYYWYRETDTGTAFSRNAIVTVSPNKSTRYILKVIDWKYAISYDTTYIMVDPECMEVDIPNVITPNGDGYNEQFLIKSKYDIDYQYIIYNRWGKQVFEGGKNNPWNGEINKSKASEGTYYYVVSVKNNTTGFIKEFSGSITVLF